MRALVLGALAHANWHANYMSFTNDYSPELSVVQTAHAGELLIKGFSVTILAMSPCRSLLIRRRPGCRARLFHVQYSRHAVRCQRMTVSGCTITRVEGEPGQYRESHDQKRRSAGFVRVRAR